MFFVLNLALLSSHVLFTSRIKTLSNCCCLFYIPMVVVVLVLDDLSIGTDDDNNLFFLSAWHGVRGNREKLFLSSLRSFFFCEELINATSSIDELLFSGIEGVTLAADFHMNVLYGRVSNAIARSAATGNRRSMRCGVNICFHEFRR